MSNQSTTTKEALEPCPFCGVTPTMQSHTQEDEMDEGRYVFFVECANSKCPMALVSTGGPYREPSKAAERWNSRVSAPIAPVVDTNGLIEWLELLVTALEADHKYDYKEWGQFIMGAENWAEKLRSASLPAEPRDHCAGASCADCKRDDCTCSHHGPASTVAPHYFVPSEMSEDFERAFFCAKRALTHLKRKNHEFKPLECDGCKEVGLFLTEPGYRGDEHNPVGVDFNRPY